MESLGDQLFASFTGSLFGLELGGLDSDFLPLFINSPLLCIFFFFSLSCTFQLLCDLIA